MIHFFDETDLVSYAQEGDPLLALLGDSRAVGMTGERWLMDSEPKRAIAWAAYEPLFARSGLRVLDVGAGFSSLSFLFAERHDYLVCDLAAHDSPPYGVEVFEGDWWDLPPADFDLVISIDLFPNVDQRLEAFLARFAPVPMRLVLTTYDDRWYRARRINADELLTVKAWTWRQARELFASDDEPPTSLFPNGRQVCLVTC